MVDPADVLDYSVSAVACQVAGTVQTLAGLTERVRHKTLSRQQRTVQIGTRQATAAADIQLAHGAQRCQVQIAIQYIQRATWQRAANRAGGGADQFGARRAVQHARYHGGFGRAIGVEQTHMAEPGVQPLCRTVQRHGFAADVDLAKRAVGARAGGQAVEQEQVPIGGRQVGQGNALGDDFIVQPRAVPQLRTAQHHGGAVGQCRVQLLDETVEVEGRELKHAILTGQP
ncbi:hypothetical protein [Pseudomonas sp. 22 E 5]|nr:hypothetical protein [Pseudomonas sp. 22 E 5]